MTNDLVKRLRAPHNWFSESDGGHRGPNNAPEEAADRIEELEAENARLRYVLGGVAAAIDTGRTEPLVIWREQIEIARAALEEKNDD